MVFNKLFKPLINTFTKDKWQSRNSEVRKKAVQNLPVSDQNTLNDIAINDADESIRAIAVNKLHDLDMLQTIIMKGTNELVKQAAQNRLFQLLCGLKHPIPDFDVREKMIRGSRNSALLEYVAEHAQEASLRELTIKRISRDPLLGNIALNDKNAQVRQLAAKQIAKRSTLERVAKNSRRKDKRVYKIIKNKLDRIIEDEERPVLLAKEVIDICNKLEKLHKRNLLLQEKSTFENYVTRWSEIQNFADSKTTERYHSICSGIINSMDELEQIQQKENEAILNLDRLLSNLSNAVDELLNIKESHESDQELIESRKKIIINLSQEWNEIIKTVNHEDTVASYNSKYQSILDLADTKTESEKLPTSNHIEIIKGLTEQAENMLRKSGFILEKTISVLQSKFKQQLENNIIPSDEIVQFQNKFDTAINQLKDQLNIQQNQAHILKTECDKHYEKIQSLINEGHITDAEKILHEQLKQIDKSVVISNIEKQHYQNELKQLQAQLGDLSSWRNWAHDKERENLVLKAEQLVEQAKVSETLDKDYPDITFAVRELRQQWKKMRSHTQEELWQRFNTACNHAYEQCTPYIEKQTVIHQENLKAKQILCQQLEDYIKTMNWPGSEKQEIDHSIDWIQVDKITRQARKEWSTIGYVERKDQKSINRRFDKAIEIIRNELKKVWQVNQEQFYNLIHLVEALHETIEEDITGAINKAKDYQQQWKKIGPVSPYQRNKLWKKFRRACDVIFDKRQENIEQKNNLNTEKLREKEAVCENLEALNQQPLNINDLEIACNDIKKLWLELKPQAKALSQDVNKRYAIAIDNFNQKIQDLISEQETFKLELLSKKAELCTQIEQLKDINDEAVSQLKEQWSEYESKPLSGPQLKHRYINALESIGADKSALMEAERNNKNDFCLN
ncbi:MAG: DUF349 domain-containing protein [gamma proteobacterium symbiont of Bathyaustriella thionipta]|nr:DUF349 domain-containing protein [gamma proteobacterium symbiont of Bathyaustriella thionipta]MCU7949681.1 DUF349 domain-containing protein [gamma proteobacterium symbiont of Bathyaustriella thionipta]MCU7953439.1 DUF349 domain-containing protein [gamma proteobacterium symbiont of Bathyaustriella thionipta]MCU7956285.1 DUF349 domain-containing protein [gamma proteobacterium symbiont of Bathyaustriella thionipta]MCU7968621.1 DUF349 domain-containing protein [gamma proteobacterium symbiont of 